jgi:hypothetical protein
MLRCARDDNREAVRVKCDSPAPQRRQTAVGFCRESLAVFGKLYFHFDLA